MSSWCKQFQRVRFRVLRFGNVPLIKLGTDGPARE